ncbi:MAG: hypothetical protein HZA31_09890 [Opitutae bacterium]|nr:hypothetical protein [Opitutae bacterium]
MRNLKTIRLIGIIVIAAGIMLFSGCATAPRKTAYPYEYPSIAATKPDAPTAALVDFTDKREDRSQDAIFSETPVTLLSKALNAELLAGGVFSKIEIGSQSAGGTRWLIEGELQDLSWAVPNHGAIVKTAFWTSFLTGGIGGLAYGATETPVFGRAKLLIRVVDRTSGKALVSEVLESVYEERMAKLKCDTPNTRGRVMTMALKQVLLKVTPLIAKTLASSGSAP